MLKKTTLNIAFGIFLSSANAFAAIPECPTRAETGSVLNFLKVASLTQVTADEAILVADCVAPFQLKVEPDQFEYATARLIHEIATTQEAAANALTSANVAYEPYLRKSMPSRAMLVKYFESNPEEVGTKKPGQIGAARKLAETNLRSLSTTAEKLKEGRAFVTLMAGTVTLNQTLTSQIFYDYARAVASCERWDFNEGTLRDDKTTRKLFCSIPCQSHAKTYFQQLDRWRAKMGVALADGHGSFIEQFRKRTQCRV